MLRQIQDTLEDKYIKSLIDECTNLLTDDISTILQYLDCNYIKVHSEKVASKEVELISLVW